MAPKTPGFGTKLLEDPDSKRFSEAVCFFGGGEVSRGGGGEFDPHPASHVDHVVVG